MKKLFCGDRNPFAKIESKVAPVLLSLEPYIGETNIFLELENSFKQGIAYSVPKGETFSVATSFTDWSDVLENTFFVITEEEGLYTTYFCLSHLDQIISLKGEGSGLILKGISGSSREANNIRAALFSMQGDDVHSVTRKTLLQALLLTGGLGKSAQDKVLPRWMNRLGWYADGRKNHDSIIIEAQKMVDSNYPLNFVMIGQGWQEEVLSSKGVKAAPMLLSFGADPIRFPSGLNGLVASLLEVGVKHVGVWHAVMGSTGGIHPRLAKKYELPPGNDGRYFLGYDMGRTFQFYHDYYNQLREEGITFVKVGDQGSPFSFCRTGMDVTRLYKNIQTAMQAAASVHFHSNHFNGDCLLNPNLFYWGSSNMTEVCSTGSIQDCLQNSFWVHNLAYPDDGVWKKYDEANAIFQALSGSCHLIKEADASLDQYLKKMLLPSKEMLQPDYPLTLSGDSLFLDPKKERIVYKAFTSKGESGVLAVFNLNEEGHLVKGRAGPRDVPFLIENRYAVFSYLHGFLGVFGMDERFSIKLKSCGADILTFAPIHLGVAVLGFYNYFLTHGPILEIDIEEENVHISALIGSPILLYCEKQVFEVRRNGETIPWEYDEQNCTLLIDSEDHVLDEHANYSIIFS